MGYQIALCYSPETEQELLSMGFEKREVLIKQAPFAEPQLGEPYSEAEKRRGDAEFFGMTKPPFQFVTTSYWGAGNGP